MLRKIVSLVFALGLSGAANADGAIPGIQIAAMWPAVHGQSHGFQVQPGFSGLVTGQPGTFWPVARLSVEDRAPSRFAILGIPVSEQKGANEDGSSWMWWAAGGVAVAAVLVAGSGGSDDEEEEGSVTPRVCGENDIVLGNDCYGLPGP